MLFLGEINALAQRVRTEHVESSANLVARIVTMNMKRRTKRKAVGQRECVQVLVRVVDDLL